MKKLLPILFIFLFNFSAAQTNVYHPFPDSNAVWRELLLATDGSFGMYQCEEEKFINGDTMLGGISYHKIYKSGLYMHCYIPCFTSDTLYYYYDHYVGVIRQDAGKRIYTYDTDQQRDTLLYDFNLNIGDTIPDSYNHLPDSIDPIIVTDIDSVFDGINYRKKFILTSAGGFPSSLIEGIGAMCGLFVELDAYHYEHSGVLHCFIQNDSVKYTDSTLYSCQIIEVVKNVPEEKITISVSPNPFHSTATFDTQYIPKYAGQKAQLKIYNALGNLVRDEKILNITSYILHREDLRDGLYFYELRTSNYELLSSGKFIIE